PSVVARGNGARFIELSTGSLPPLTEMVDPAVLAAAPAPPVPPPPRAPAEAAVIEKLQVRVTQLEALLSRDEAVIRKLLGLLIDSRLLTREQILGCLHEG